jgi:branched-chain amino acid aminotransferase
MGLEVEERPLPIEEIIAAYQAGTLREIFGTGTAATISMIKELGYKDFSMEFDVASWTIAPGLKKRMDEIKYGLVPDTHGWMIPV